MVFTICHNNNQISDFLYANDFQIHNLVKILLFHLDVLQYLLSLFAN